MPAFSAATNRLTAKNAAANDVMGVDDTDAALSKGITAGEVANLRAYLGSTQENADTNTVYYEPAARRTAATPATGFGYGVKYTIQTDAAATPNTEQAGAWRLVSTDLTGGSEDWKWVFELQIAGAALADVIEFTKDGFNAPTGKAYYAAGVQVLGAQGASVADALTGGSATAADCATQLNLVLARLRAHGLIAT